MTGFAGETCRWARHRPASRSRLNCSSLQAVYGTISCHQINERFLECLQELHALAKGKPVEWLPVTDQPQYGIAVAGKLQLHILAALAEFERERIRERVLAGLQRAKAQGKRLGRPRGRPAAVAILFCTVMATVSAETST